MRGLKTFMGRAASLILSVLLVAGSYSGVMAKSYDDIEKDYDYKEQVDILSDIGVILGTTENEFSPDEPVTREQMALLLFRLMLGRGNAGIVNTTDFEDLYDETYHGAISWASSAGYIIGTSPTTFEPLKGITLQDAMTMIVRALGQSNQNMDKGYPWTYIDAAIKLGLDNDLEGVDYEDNLTRGEVAAILYTALTAEYLVPKTQNGNTYLESTTVIESVFGYELDKAILTATNDYALEGSTVVKDGYVTFKSGGSKMTVKFDELGLDGEPNDWLGKELSLIYKADSANKTVSVLGSSYTGRSEMFDDVTLVSRAIASVSIGGVKYNIVEELSDSLSTNDNELLVYVYDNSGVLKQIKNNNELSAHLGFYSLEMIYDSADSEVGNRAILKNYKFGRLGITDGKINLAGNLTADKLTGGYINEVGAVSGDYVLYYFNSGNKKLEIAEVLRPADKQLVSKLTATTATIGGTEYTLGNPGAGVSVESVRNLLSVGSYVSPVVKGGMLLAIYDGTPISVTSEYLVVLSTPVPVYSDGILRYAVAANINGAAKDIFVANPNVNVGEVYRYITDANGYYTLIDKNSPNFTVAGEYVESGTQSGDATISMNGNPYFSHAGVNFVTDENTVILVKNGDNYTSKHGVYLSDITVKNGASMTAILRNEPGTVETLRYLYISDGSLGTVDATTQYVKILSRTSAEFINGTVYTTYTVLNMNTGAKDTKYSLYSDLTVGESYAIDSAGRITNVAHNSVVEGIVSGYTSSTITVGGTVYKLAAGAKIVDIAANLTVTEKTIADTFMHSVEFIVSGNEVKAVIIGDKLSFVAAAASAGNTSLVFTPTVDITGIADSDVVLTKVMQGAAELDLSRLSLTVETVEDEEVLVFASEGLAAAAYTVSFTVCGSPMTVSFTVAASAG